MPRVPGRIRQGLSATIGFSTLPANEDVIPARDSLLHPNSRPAILRRTQQGQPPSHHTFLSCDMDEGPLPIPAKASAQPASHPIRVFVGKHEPHLFFFIISIY